jgi:hypothetical protein
LCRLACAAVEEFLTDSTEPKRPEGRITRAVIDPWWDGVKAVGGAEMAALEAEFRGLVAGDDKPAMAAFAEKVHPAVREWTAQLVNRLTQGEGDPGLKPIFAGRNLMADLREVARILPLAGALSSGLEAVIAAAQSESKAKGRWLPEIGPATAAEAARQYRRVRDAHGVDVGYFALALINRLERPWDILQLGRELAWRQEGSLVRDTEFGAVGRRLLREFESLVREVTSLAAAGEGSLAPLAGTLERYAEACEALLGEGGFRRGSTWAEEVTETRGAVAEALGQPFVQRLAAAVRDVLPQRGSGKKAEPETRVIPDQPAIVHAAEAARLIVFLRERGAKLGLAPAAVRAAEQTASELARRMQDLAAAAKGGVGSAALAAQIEAAALISDILFAEGGGEDLAKELQRARKLAVRTEAD